MPQFYVLAQLEQAIAAGTVTEAIMKAQAELDRVRLLSPEKPSHEALKWYAWKVDDET